MQHIQASTAHLPPAGQCTQFDFDCAANSVHHDYLLCHICCRCIAA
jgi:hypothetical protein